MKPFRKTQSWLSSLSFQFVPRPAAFAASVAICVSCGNVSSAADLVWTTGASGDFSDPNKYTPAGAPAATGDGVTADGTFAIAYGTGLAYSLTNLVVSGASGQGNFNQTGGDLTIGTLYMGRSISGGNAAGGASRVPAFNLSAGTVSTGTIVFGNGSSTASGAPLAGIRINQTAGTFNFTGSGTLNLGGPATGQSSINVSGGTFNANTATLIHVGNGTTDAKGVINLSGGAAFNAPLATVVLGQQGSSAIAAGTLNISGTSTMSAATVVIGGNNAGFNAYGVLNLNGGTLSTGSIRKGSSLTASSLTANVLHANGGTVKAVTHANNSNFFLGAFVDLQAGGLTFDTDSNNVTITNVMSGVGGLTKAGDGILTLTGTNTYAGATTVAAGQLTIGSATVIPDTNNLTVMDGALVMLDGIQERVGSLTLGPTAYTANGTYGSSISGADVQNDAFFSGTGTILIGPPQPARNLVWTAAAAEANAQVPIWMTAGPDANFINSADSSATTFHTGDVVAFNDLANPDLMQVIISGNVHSGGMIFNNTAGNSYVVSGDSGSIFGSSGIVKNGAGDVTVGGAANSYTGAIAVNSGKLTMGSNSAFGNTSGITVASGAQVDINGKAPGSVFTYSVSGTGPGGTGVIVNSGAARFGDAGIKNLVMTGDTSIGSNGNRFDFGQGGTVTGNNHTLTKVGTNDMGLRGDASGTPINIVVAAGNVWAEGTANAYGGATGTLTIKSGSRAGTYGILTIATPVSIESGGTLHNQGVATGTWTGNFSLSGNVTIDSAGSPIAINGNISGTANITKSGVSNVTIADPDHVGNTTVTSGPLTLTSATLNDAATISLNGATSTLSLSHGTSDTVDKLVLDGVQQTAGTYVSATNTQSIPGAIPTAHIIGDTGSLIVSTNPVVTGYSTWADANVTNPAYASLKGREDDPDADGFANIQEFLFGTDPQSSTGTLTEMSQSGANLLVRWNERATGATYILQESMTLAEDPWPTSGVTPVVAVDQSGVHVDYTRKEATVPINIARKFVRVVGIEN